MKSLKPLILAALLTATAAAGGCSDTKSNSSPTEDSSEVQNISPEDILFKWQKPYQDKLDEVKSADSAYDAFDLFDLTGDGNPELIISQGTERTSVCEIYTFEGGALSSLGTAGFDGTFDYLPEFGLIREEYHGDGFLLGKFRQYEGGEITDFLTYSDNSESASSGASIKHEINGEEVLLPDYDATLAQYVDTLTMHLGRKYTFGDDSENYALRRAESWGGVLGSKRKAACKKKLLEIADELGEDKKDAAFELCDLNGDDTPEIIVSSGSVTDAACTIYYFSGNEIEQLDGEYGRYGRLLFDIGSLVFYSESETGFTYWSLADSDFSADKYKSSGSIMEAGRRFPLTSTGIDASLV
ncbi:MAG: hypothetical protein Q4A05_11775 [Ruminococcus sp.]|nr:hypothetical protein [Ruminococcus sp.]